MSEIKEGWQEYKNDGQRVYHYIGEDGFSLCRKLGFYFAGKMPWTGKPKQKDDCSQCYKKAQQYNEISN